MTRTLRPAALRHTGRRALALALVTVAAVTLVGAWGGGTAEAASYRFWSYWVGGGSDWSFSSQGASRRPPDGGVDGWRFAISPDSASAVQPRRSPSFDRICRGTPEQDGQKRVGLVIDFGTTSDAPEGESPPQMLTTCAVVPEDANGYEVLTTVAQLRIDDGMICGINGYPATECGKVVSDPTTSPDDDGDGEQSGNSGDNTGGSGTGGQTSQKNGSGTAGSGEQAGDKSDDQPSDKKRDKNDGKKREQGKSASATPDPEAADQSTSAASALQPTAGAPSSGSPVGLIAGVAVIVGIGAAAFVLARRRG
ncbi:MAG TPA: SCO2322 family protein [Actinomycetes bacterium]|nr:SCO2322 family protein [Actinomycetes bacterium]